MRSRKEREGGVANLERESRRFDGLSSPVNLEGAYQQAESSSPKKKIKIKFSFVKSNIVFDSLRRRRGSEREPVSS